MEIMIDKTVLSVINLHIDELDSLGVYPFCNNVIRELADYHTRRVANTLGLFLANLFEDDVKELLDALFESGFRKLDAIDELNEIIGYTGYSSYGDIGMMCRSYLQSGIPSSKEPGKIIPIDLDYVKNNSEFLFEAPIETYEKVSKPFIETSPVRVGNIDVNSWDKLFVAVQKGNSPYRSKGVQTSFSTIYSVWQQLVYPGRPIVYCSIKSLADALEKTGDKLDLDTIINAALPREVIEEHGIPIVDASTLI